MGACCPPALGTVQLWSEAFQHWLAGMWLANPLSTASLAPAGLAGIPATGPVVVADRLAEASRVLLKLWSLAAAEVAATAE